MPRYLTFGNSTRFGLCDYYGPVIASPEALFLMLAVRPGGLVGGLLQMGVEKLSRKKEITYLCDLSEFPEEITTDPDWPLKKKKKGEVIVVPRADIKSLRLGSWLHSLLTIKTPERTFQAGVSIFKRSKLREFFTEHGWELKE